MDLLSKFGSFSWILGVYFCLMTVKAQEFDSAPEELKVMRGHNVTIHCRVRNLGAYNIFWLKDSTVLSLNHLIMTSNDRYSIVGRYNLQINDVEDGDEAKYQCQVSSSPPMSQFHSIMVTVPPTVELVNKTKVVEATLGDDIVFQCTATGRPHPNITWVRQDKMMAYGEDYIFGDTLRLSSLEYNHGGLYKCIASNDVGDDAEDSVRLKVLYAPTIYTEEKVIITGPGEEVSIPCLASAQPSPKVEWRHNGDKISLRSLPQNKELRLIEQGFKTDYTLYIKSLQDSDFGNFTCVVKNNRGKAVHKLVLTPLPSKSEIMSDIKGNYSNVFELNWMTVSVVKLDNYRLMVRNVINETLTGNWSEVDIEAENTSGPIHSQSYMIQDLEPETMYEVILQAHNNYGWGEASNVFIFETNKAGLTPPTPTLPNPHIHSSDEEEKSNAGVTKTTEYSILLVLLFITLLLS